MAIPGRTARKTERGFTLLETIFFVVIIAIAVGGIFSVFTEVLKSPTVILDMTHATLLADGKSDEVLARASEYKAASKTFTPDFFNDWINTTNFNDVVNNYSRTVTFTQATLDTVTNVVTCSGTPDTAWATSCTTSTCVGVCAKVTITDANSNQLANVYPMVTRW